MGEKCPEKFQKGDSGPPGPQGPRGNDGNAAVIMDIIQNDQHITTKPLTTDQAIHVKQLAEKACKEVYRWKI